MSIPTIGGRPRNGRTVTGLGVRGETDTSNQRHVAIDESEPSLSWTEVELAVQNGARSAAGSRAADATAPKDPHSGSGGGVAESTRAGNINRTSHYVPANPVQKKRVYSYTTLSPSRNLEATTFAPPSRRMHAWPVPSSTRTPDLPHYVGHAPSVDLPTNPSSPRVHVQGSGVAALLLTSKTKVGDLPAYEQALLALGRHASFDPIALDETEPAMLQNETRGEIRSVERGERHAEEYKAALCRLRQGVDDAIGCQDPAREFDALTSNRSFKASRMASYISCFFLVRGFFCWWRWCFCPSQPPSHSLPHSPRRRSPSPLLPTPFLRRSCCFSLIPYGHNIPRIVIETGIQIFYRTNHLE